MPQEAEARYVGQRVDSVEPGQQRAGRVEPRGIGDELTVSLDIDLVFLHCGGEDAHAQRLAENELVARFRIAVLLDLAGMHQPEHYQTVDRLDRIDAVSARDRDTGLAADRFAAREDPPDDFRRKLV